MNEYWTLVMALFLLELNEALSGYFLFFCAAFDNVSNSSEQNERIYEENDSEPDQDTSIKDVWEDDSLPDQDTSNKDVCEDDSLPDQDTSIKNVREDDSDDSDDDKESEVGESSENIKYDKNIESQIKRTPITPVDAADDDSNCSYLSLFDISLNSQDVKEFFSRKMNNSSEQPCIQICGKYSESDPNYYIAEIQEIDEPVDERKQGEPQGSVTHSKDYECVIGSPESNDNGSDNEGNEKQDNETAKSFVPPTTFIDSEAELSGEDDDDDDDDDESDESISEKDEESSKLFIKEVKEKVNKILNQVEIMIIDDGELNNNGSYQQSRYAWNNSANVINPENLDKLGSGNEEDMQCEDLNGERLKWMQNNVNINDDLGDVIKKPKMKMKVLGKTVETQKTENPAKRSWTSLMEAEEIFPALKKSKSMQDDDNRSKSYDPVSEVVADHPASDYESLTFQDSNHESIFKNI